MNFLGHFYLSGQNTGLILGNYIADFVKGKKYLDYPEEISRGIVMHREIDHFTDHHPCVKDGKKRLFTKYRHFSGIIIDMYFDHFLASDWERYGNGRLEDFSRFIYDIIEMNLPALPAPSQYMFTYMKRGNWLVRYASMEGLQKTLTGMASRINHASKLDEAHFELQMFYDEFRAEFHNFMEDLNATFNVK